ncbi:phage tail tape measure protein, TP901 family, core region [Nitrosomonas aestuarii]|uniref:Phage tail tape measure protein, TP901 family, core region n=1 Tax=Nitrosomonas aestuarii TaxID=52441 RepID=A0A1I4C2I5_9PROT|nr:phage tail tape measure protein [Nitrosomonas aestuarii]SFK74371.1 phage tail tape measure protein, TP901 family, core region [Nitrosomonas aestuarii]
MSALGSLVVKLALDHAEYTQGLDRNSQAALKFAQKTQRSFESTSSSIKSFAARSVAQIGVLVGSVAGLNASLNSALDFDRQLAEVSTLLSGSTEETKLLATEAERLAQQFGTMPIEQAKAFYQVISAGASDASEATDILTAANKLAVGGVTDVLTSVDGLTSILNAYGDQVESAAAVSDTLFIGMRTGKTTIAELSSNLGKVAPLAASLNVGFDELVSSIAALTKGGINTTESITGVRSILAAVAKPTKEAANLSGQLGIEFNAAGLQAKGFAGFLDEVRDKTGGSVDKLSLLFGGVEALVPIMALSGNAGRDFNDIMAQMGEKAGATEEAFNKMADSRGFKIDQLMASINSIALTLGGTLADVLAPAAEWAAGKLNSLFGTKQELSAIEQKRAEIVSLRKELDNLNKGTGVPVLDDLFGNLFYDKRQADLLEQRLEDGIADLAALEKQMEETAKAAESLNKPIIKTGENQGGSSPPTNKLTSSLDDQDQVMQELEREVKRLTLAYDPLIKRNQDLAKVTQLVSSGLREDIAEQEYARIINDYIIATGDAADSVTNITEQTNILGERTVDVFGSNEQFIIQSMRNVQSAVANSLFNFFDDGLKGMVRSVKSAVGRIIAEFASMKLLQASGIGSLFGLGSTPALASGGGGIGALDVASLVSGGTNLLSTGLGTTSLVGGGLTAAGTAFGSGSLAAFGGGLAGDAIGGLTAGISAGASTSSAAAAASAGSMAASIAGPLVIAAIADIGFRALAGDKTMGNFADNIPLVGSLGALFFGRGPLKQKETNLIGDFTADGFSGVTSTKFKAQGGLARSDKVDRIINDTDTGELLNQYRELVEGGISSALDPAAEQTRLFALEIGEHLDQSVRGISGSLRDVATNLGIGTDAIDSFSSSINIASEKGEALTEQQIDDEIAKVADAMATALIPEIDSLSRSGETAFQTIQRLGIEFASLEDTLRVMGETSSEARELLRGFSIEQRTQFVDMAGGIDVLNQQVDFFFNNILSDSDRLRIRTEDLSKELAAFGVDFIPTVKQLREFVSSGNGTAEQIGAAFRLAPLIAEVDQLKQSIDGVSGSVSELDNVNTAFDALTRSVDAERNRIQLEYNDAVAKSSSRIADVKDQISGLDALTKSLKSSVSTLSPLSRNQALEQITGAIAAARQGIFPEVADIKDALGVLTGSRSTGGFKTEFDFLSDQSRTAGLINELGGLADDELTLQKRSLSALELQRERIDAEFKDANRNLDQILDNARAQLDVLNRIDRSLLSLLEARQQFGAAVQLANAAQPSRGTTIAVGGSTARTSGIGTVLSATDGTNRGRGSSSTSDPVVTALNAVNTTLQKVVRGTDDTATTLSNVVNGNTSFRTR